MNDPNKNIENLVTILNAKLLVIEEKIKELEWHQTKTSSIIDTILRILEIQTQTKEKQCQKNSQHCGLETICFPEFSQFIAFKQWDLLRIL